eukprot:881694-Amphidinium_carterae.1
MSRTKHVEAAVLRVCMPFTAPVVHGRDPEPSEEFLGHMSFAWLSESNKELTQNLPAHAGIQAGSALIYANGGLYIFSAAALAPDSAALKAPFHD